MKKSILKSSLACLAAMSIGFVGYSSLSNTAKAQPDYKDLEIKRVDDEKKKDMIGVKQATELNVVYRLSETVDKLLKKKKPINDKQLEILSYFAFQYLNSQNTYVSAELNNQLDPITLVNKVQAIAEMSDLEPYFKVSKDKLEVVKKLDAPENFDEILASIEAQVKEQIVESTIENEKSEEMSDDIKNVDVSIEESNDLLEVVESHED